MLQIAKPWLRAHLPALAAWPLGAPYMALLYIALYALLDWASFVYPYSSFGITPWNPPTGVSFALVLLYGRRYLPLLLVAPFVADWLVRDWPLPFMVELGSLMIVAVIYIAVLILLTSPSIAFDPRLGSVADVTVLIVAALTSSGLAAIGSVGVLTFSAMLAPSEFWSAVLRFWIGDAIGVMIFTPFLLIIGTGQMPELRSRETMVDVASILAMVLVIFNLPFSPYLQLLYLLFLPIIWTALRSGLERVSVALVVMQISLIAGVQLTQEKAGTVTSFQVLLLVLAVTGLLMGAVVSQQRSAERQLRIQQEALAKVSRIGSMGALGAAIAHEINQPLSAIATYADIVQHEVSKSHTDNVVALEAARKTVAQVRRAAEIVRRLRNLIRLGQSEAGPYPVQQLVDESLALLHDDIERSQAVVRTRLPQDLPSVVADRLQVEQVLINLIRNAIEAMIHQADKARAIDIEIEAVEPGFVTFTVRDSGPGFAENAFKDDVMPLATTKADGMGLGLMLCKTIVEAHGGRLWVAHRATGGLVHFTLRRAAA